MSEGTHREPDNTFEGTLARMHGRRVYLDTNAFIYLLEGTPDVGDPVVCSALHPTTTGMSTRFLAH